MYRTVRLSEDLITWLFLSIIQLMRSCILLRYISSILILRTFYLQDYDCVPKSVRISNITIINMWISDGSRILEGEGHFFRRDGRSSGKNYFLRSIQDSINSFFVRFLVEKIENFSLRRGAIASSLNPPLMWIDFAQLNWLPSIFSSKSEVLISNLSIVLQNSIS